jgi:opacity protein-like surface antigen
MRRATVVLTLALLGALPAKGRAGSMDVRFGGFFPRAESNLFADDAELYVKDGRALKRSDWDGGTAGIQFNQGVARNVELGFSIDVYDRTLHTSYRDFVTPTDREIQQSLKLNIVPLGASVRLGPTGRGQLSPYLSAGADLFFYRYEEFGDFIDFDVASHPIINDSFVSEGVAPGFHVAGGVRVPLGDDFSISAEGRYQWAKDDMGDDFRGNTIDLTGASATLGVNIRF